MSNHTVYNNVSVLRAKLHQASKEAHANGQHREFLAALAHTLIAELNHASNRELRFREPLEHLSSVLVSATRVVGSIEPDMQFVLDQMQLARNGFIAEHPSSKPTKEPLLL